MNHQININDFFTKCGSTSTPRTSRRGSYTKTHISEMKDTIPVLLDSKENFPILFNVVCQNHLNDLELGLSENIFVHKTEKEKSRRRSPIISRRSRSRNRDRSMSPSGAKKIKESEWDNNIEIALILIEEILKNHNKLPEMFMLHNQFKSESESLLEGLLKSNNIDQKLKRLKDSNLYVVGQCFRMFLAKLGVLLPEIISEQLLLLKSLTCKDGDKLVKLKKQIEAVQILMLAINNKSRLIIQKIVNVFHVLSKLTHVNVNLVALSKLLSPCLFEEESQKDNLKICTDFIILSDRIFDPPVGIMNSLKNKLNKRPDIPHEFDINIKIKANHAIKSNVPIKSCAATIKLNGLFSHLKVLPTVEPVVLKGVKKLSSPDKHVTDEMVKCSKKRKSFTDISRKIIEKSVSPFKKRKEYNLSEYYKQKKSIISKY